MTEALNCSPLGEIDPHWTPPQTVVFGITGYLGRHVFQAYSQFFPDLIGTERQGEHALDLQNPDISHLALEKKGYQYAVIAAGMSNVGVCEQHPQLTHVCNVEGTLTLAKQLLERHIVPIYLSSAYVFDGEEGNYSDDAICNPLNHYGKQKMEVEQRLLEISQGNCLILRLGKVLGTQRGDGTLLDEMAKKLTQGERVQAAYNQRLSPLWVSDFTQILITLQKLQARGIINLCSPEVWTRLDIARCMAHILGVNLKQVESISLESLGNKLPKYTNMLCHRLYEYTMVAFTPLTQCMQHIAKAYHR